MTFISTTFFIFFIFTLVVRLLTYRTDKQPHWLYLRYLALASFVFYGWFIPLHLLLMLASSSVDWFVGRQMVKYPGEDKRRRYCLLISIITNLSFLSFFKYLDFGITQVNAAAELLGSSLDIPTLQIILPIGISFYTFQSLSYTIDIYRGQFNPLDSLWRFWLYVGFFPQLVAGPIVRPEFINQFAAIKPISYKAWIDGAALMVKGFFFKLVIADGVGVIVDRHWASISAEDVNCAFTFTILLFVCAQFYADFSAYSNIARGIAKILGFELPVNFRCPFLSVTLREFWDRWHITLSTWIRDYLFRPLGGHRTHGIRNIVTIFALSGLWHGASLTFLAWGLFHAIAILTEGAIFHNRRKYAALRMVGNVVYVNLVLLVGAALFRGESLTQSIAVIGNCFSYFSADPTPWKLLAPGFFLFGFIVLEHAWAYLEETYQEKSSPLLWPYKYAFHIRGFAHGAMAYLSLVMYGRGGAFVYFQF